MHATCYYASNNRKRDNVKITRIHVALDLHDVRRFFSLNVNSFFYLELETCRGVI